MAAIRNDQRQYVVSYSADNLGTFCGKLVNKNVWTLFLEKRHLSGSHMLLRFIVSALYWEIL